MAHQTSKGLLWATFYGTILLSSTVWGSSSFEIVSARSTSSIPRNSARLMWHPSALQSHKGAGSSSESSGSSPSLALSPDPDCPDRMALWLKNIVDHGRMETSAATSSSPSISAAARETHTIVPTVTSSGSSSGTSSGSFTSRSLDSLGGEASHHDPRNDALLRFLKEVIQDDVNAKAMYVAGGSNDPLPVTVITGPNLPAITNVRSFLFSQDDDTAAQPDGAQSEEDGWSSVGQEEAEAPPPGAEFNWRGFNKIGEQPVYWNGGIFAHTPTIDTADGPIFLDIATMQALNLAALWPLPARRGKLILVIPGAWLARGSDNYQDVTALLNVLANHFVSAQQAAKAMAIIVAGVIGEIAPKSLIEEFRRTTPDAVDSTFNLRNQLSPNAGSLVDYLVRLDRVFGVPPLRAEANEPRHSFIGSLPRRVLAINLAAIPSAFVDNIARITDDCQQRSRLIDDLTSREIDAVTHHITNSLVPLTAEKWKTDLASQMKKAPLVIGVSRFMGHEGSVEHVRELIVSPPQNPKDFVFRLKNIGVPTTRIEEAIRLFKFLRNLTAYPLVYDLSFWVAPFNPLMAAAAALGLEPKIEWNLGLSKCL